MPEEPPFPVIDVTGWEIIAEEASGAEAKFWLEEPVTKVHWLFKSVTVKAGNVHGEDWAEKVASHLGNRAGIPCARVEMAVRGDSAGCISANLCPSPLYQMQPGRVHLEKCGAEGYVHRSTGKDHPGHSLPNIHAALAGVLPPPGCDLPFAASAFDVFAGYVQFDAWIANQDRHDQNWSVLIASTVTDVPTRLSGSYDHASSLAFNELDSTREKLLRGERGGVEKWCGRGKANRFEGRPRLVEAAVAAFQLASPDGRAYWTSQLQQVSVDDVVRVLARIQKMSDTTRTFTRRVLEVNRRRVLDACT